MNTERLALVFAAVDKYNFDKDKGTISTIHLERALLLLDYWKSVNGQLFSRLTANLTAAQEGIVLQKLGMLGNDATKRELHQKVGSQKMSAKEFNEVVRNLVESAVIVEVKNGRFSPRIIRVSR